ncbi:Conserved hypothetical protein [Methylocystis sp. SC2]|nr:Conserved hypothetical protein [Methylocystis sp. SC2]
MDALTWFGLFAVSAMLLAYALEERSHWFVLGFAAACALGSIYGFLQGAWPFGLIEAVWALVALKRWRSRRSASQECGEALKCNVDDVTERPICVIAHFAPALNRTQETPDVHPD